MNHVDTHTHQIAAICAGIGMLEEGLQLGLEALGIRSRVVCVCERESYAATVQLARMADSSLVEAAVCDSLADINERWRGHIDWIVAGFPCQPWSCAGQQKGTDDERWIWEEILGVIDRVQPGFCFFENVPGLAAGVPEWGTMADGTKGLVRSDGLDIVLRTLAERGFDAEWTHLSAEDVGASHKRERVFILAHRGRQHVQLFQRGARPESQAKGGELANPRLGLIPQPGLGAEGRDGAGSGGEDVGDSANDHGRRGDSAAETGTRPGGIGRRGFASASPELAFPTLGGLGELRQSSRGDGFTDGGQRELADAKIKGCSQCSEHDGRPETGQQLPRRGHSDGCDSQVADARCEPERARAESGSQKQPDAGKGRAVVVNSGKQGYQRAHNHTEPSRRIQQDVEQRSHPILAPGPNSPAWPAILAIYPHLAPAVEPGFRLLADGNAPALDAHRADQLRCVGNAVNPHCAAVAICILLARAKTG